MRVGPRQTPGGGQVISPLKIGPVARQAVILTDSGPESGQPIEIAEHGDHVEPPVEGSQQLGLQEPRCPIGMGLITANRLAMNPLQRAPQAGNIERVSDPREQQPGRAAIDDAGQRLPEPFQRQISIVRPEALHRPTHAP